LQRFTSLRQQLLNLKRHGNRPVPAAHNGLFDPKDACMTCHRRTLLASAALGALSAALPAAAQDTWPTKTVRLIVPYAAGGFADTRARKIADALGKTLGQPVIVDNRAGAGVSSFSVQ